MIETSCTLMFSCDHAEHQYAEHGLPQPYYGPNSAVCMDQALWAGWRDWTGNGLRLIASHSETYCPVHRPKTNTETL